MSSSLKLACQHIIKHLTDNRPLFVGLQGPQGSGKSFLASQLRTRLQSPPHTLRVVVLSIDDLYSPHDDLVALSLSRNPLWKGRGHPGTHDTTLGIDILSRLKSGCTDIELPSFDKSLYGGEGDRLPLDGTGIIVKQPPTVDVVILEGWFVGFCPISNESLQERWENTWNDERQKLGLQENIQLADIKTINDKLHDYISLWNFFDIFIQVSLKDLHQNGLFNLCLFLAKSKPTTISNVLTIFCCVQMAIGTRRVHESPQWWSWDVRGSCEIVRPLGRHAVSYCLFFQIC